MESFKQIVDFFYQHFQVCSNVANIIFIAIPAIICLITLFKLWFNWQDFRTKPKPGPVTISKYYLNQGYLFCIAILCVYSGLRTLEAVYYQIKLAEINTRENQELKLREKLWDVEKQTFELEIKKLLEQLKQQQLQEKIEDKKPK